MAKLTYWVAERLDDSRVYSLIGKTKKEVVELVKEWSASEGIYRIEFGPVEKRVIEYRDAFDLFDQVSGEGGGRLAGWRVGKGE
jgi:hypothetical protein